eukprot:TRINITY_DN594_c0_g1_i1.p1 TRINITY_DN594_c0_g1~~TRINITY_DN594_c0_g1_i1.p1  ORF type:complete len:858 (+),score=177.86 TRINITY_DN594_c0_g1_i1:48-2621(+)
MAIDFNEILCNNTNLVVDRFHLGPQIFQPCVCDCSIFSKDLNSIVVLEDAFASLNDVCLQGDLGSCIDKLSQCWVGLVENLVLTADISFCSIDFIVSSFLSFVQIVFRVDTTPLEPSRARLLTKLLALPNSLASLQISTAEDTAALQKVCGGFAALCQECDGNFALMNASWKGLVRLLTCHSSTCKSERMLEGVKLAVAEAGRNAAQLFELLHSPQTSDEAAADRKLKILRFFVAHLVSFVKFDPFSFLACAEDVISLILFIQTNTIPYPAAYTYPPVIAPLHSHVVVAVEMILFQMFRVCDAQSATALLQLLAVTTPLSAVASSDEQQHQQQTQAVVSFLTDAAHGTGSDLYRVDPLACGKLSAYVSLLLRVAELPSSAQQALGECLGALREAVVQTSHLLLHVTNGAQSYLTKVICAMVHMATVRWNLTELLAWAMDPHPVVACIGQEVWSLVLVACPAKKRGDTATMLCKMIFTAGLPSDSRNSLAKLLARIFACLPEECKLWVCTQLQSPSPGYIAGVTAIMQHLPLGALPVGQMPRVVDSIVAYAASHLTQLLSGKAKASSLILIFELVTATMRHATQPHTNRVTAVRTIGTAVQAVMDHPNSKSSEELVSALCAAAAACIQCMPAVSVVKFVTSVLHLAKAHPSCRISAAQMIVACARIGDSQATQQQVHVVIASLSQLLLSDDDACVFDAAARAFVRFAKTSSSTKFDAMLPPSRREFVIAFLKQTALPTNGPPSMSELDLLQHDALRLPQLLIEKQKKKNHEAVQANQSTLSERPVPKIGAHQRDSLQDDVMIIDESPLMDAVHAAQKACSVACAQYEKASVSARKQARTVLLNCVSLLTKTTHDSSLQ